VKKEDIKPLLVDLYENDSSLLGKGIRSLYRYLSNLYANITLSDVQSFLTSQPSYQLQISSRGKSVSRPIISKFPNQRWGIDLIDMDSKTKTHAAQYKYIMTVIDIFSRNISNLPNHQNSAQVTRDALEDVIDEAQIALEGSRH
jgi:hypothetical protein